MVRVEELLDLLNTLIFSSMENTITTSKTTLQSIVTFLEFTQAKETLLRTRNRLIQGAHELRNLRQYYELVLFHSPIFEDDEADLDQQPTQQELSKIAPYLSVDKVQLPLSNPIIRPWEEIINNKHITSVRYENDVTFPNPEYTKLIQFQSAILLQESLYSPAPVQEKIMLCQHC
jgi:hypothetical protein